MLANGVTGRRGAFRLDARGGTPVYVRVTRLGYRELRTPLAELQPGAGPLVIRLESAPVALPEVAAEATRASRYLQGVGFYERQRMGFGSFVTREMIERDYFTARTPGDILRTQRGLHVREGRDSAIVYMPRSMLRLETRGEEAGTCPARVYINGLDQGSAVPVNLRPDGIEAIEIYRGPADVPAQFGGARGACGVILLWLRTGQS